MLVLVALPGIIPVHIQPKCHQIARANGQRGVRMPGTWTPRLGDHGAYAVTMVPTRACRVDGHPDTSTTKFVRGVYEVRVTLMAVKPRILTRAVALVGTRLGPPPWPALAQKCSGSGCTCPLSTGRHARAPGNRPAHATPAPRRVGACCHPVPELWVSGSRACRHARPAFGENRWYVPYDRVAARV